MTKCKLITAIIIGLSACPVPAAEWHAVPTSTGSDDLAALQLACEAGDATACYELGSRYRVGNGVEKDAIRARQLYQKACDGDVAYSCNDLGSMHANADGVLQDYVRAAGYYQRACDKGDALGCFNIGGMYDEGAGVPLNDEKAVELYRQACSGGALPGCQNLAWMYREGEGTPRMPGRAAELFRKTCDSGVAQGCYDLATMKREGLGVPRDEQEAKSLYDKARQLGNQSANSFTWTGSFTFSASIEPPEDCKQMKVLEFKFSCAQIVDKYKYTLITLDELFVPLEIIEDGVETAQLKKRLEMHRRDVVTQSEDWVELGFSIDEDVPPPRGASSESAACARYNRDFENRAHANAKRGISRTRRRGLICTALQRGDRGGDAVIQVVEVYIEEVNADLDIYFEVRNFEAIADRLFSSLKM